MAAVDKMPSKRRTERRRKALSRKTIYKRIKAKDTALNPLHSVPTNPSSTSSLSHSEIKNNANPSITAVESPQQQPSLSPLLPLSVTPQNTKSPQVKLKPLINRSASKLNRNSFVKNLLRTRRITRQAASRLGLGSKSRKKITKATGFKIQDVSLLNECLLKGAVCRKCKLATSKLELYEKSNQRKGLAEEIVLKCSSCKHETSLHTSRKITTNDHKNSRQSYEVNLRSVYASLDVGTGRSGLQKFCSNLDLPEPVTKKPFNNISKLIHKSSISNADQLLIKSGKELHQITLEHSPEDVDVLNDGTMLANVAVTVDGSWQRRGHASKIGVVFVMSVVTGEVLDYEVKSLFCHECSSRSKDDKTSLSYKKWAEKHSPNCQLNHQGSSDSMEATGATAIFMRSIKKHNLKYTTFVGDGDSSCFGRVKEKLLQEYGDMYLISKEECVGHIQKRLGSAFREYKRKMRGMKLSDGKAVGGKNRLTDKVIDKMQNYFGSAIRDHSGNKTEMVKAIWAVFKHMIRNDDESLEQQHENCPNSSDTWCKFWRSKNETSLTYNDSSRLPHVFIDELKPIFKRLTSEELLGRCLKGLTQNQNEAINAVVWHHCPKTQFCGRRRVEIAVCTAISNFNAGATNSTTVLSAIGIQPSQNFFSAAIRSDTNRIKNAARKTSDAARIERRKLRAKRKSKVVEATTYMPGMFGISTKPDEFDFSVTKTNGNKVVKKKVNREMVVKKSTGASKEQPENFEVEIQFIDENDLIVFRV